MNNQRQFVLGIFFIVALSILAVYTLFLTDVHIFSTPTYETVYFPKAYGLREGNSVLAEGLRIGRVKSLEFDGSAPPEKRIKATLSLDEPVELLEGARITISESTLLGGRHINIDPGVFGGPPLARDPDGALYGEIERNPIAALSDLGKLFTDNRETMNNILENFDSIITDVNAGKGPLGRLINDEEMGQNFSESVTAFRNVTTEIDRGEGLIGALLRDNEMRMNFSSAVDSLRVIGADLEAGRGLAGQLIYDDELANGVRDAVEAFSNLGQRIERGEGVAGRLLADEDLGAELEVMVRDFKSTAANLEEISRKITEGEGTLGLLLADRELYDQAVASVRLLTRSLEDYREAAPITAFTSVFFSAF